MKNIIAKKVLKTEIKKSLSLGLIHFGNLDLDHWSCSIDMT